MTAPHVVPPPFPVMMLVWLAPSLPFYGLLPAGCLCCCCIRPSRSGSTLLASDVMARTVTLSFTKKIIRQKGPAGWLNWCMETGIVCVMWSVAHIWWNASHSGKVNHVPFQGPVHLGCIGSASFRGEVMMPFQTTDYARWNDAERKKNHAKGISQEVVLCPRFFPIFKVGGKA